MKRKQQPQSVGHPPIFARGFSLACRTPTSRPRVYRPSIRLHIPRVTSRGSNPLPGKRANRKSWFWYGRCPVTPLPGLGGTPNPYQVTFANRATQFFNERNATEKADNI